MDNKNTRQYLDVLQILRGIAAMLVVVHHSIGSLRHYHKLDNEFVLFIGLIGKFGVDFFFVLSGFIIAYSNYFKQSQPAEFKNYIVNRFLRIYVPYLPIGIVMLLLYTYIPSFSSSDRSISLLTSLTLIPEGNPALSVAWTLSFEMFFYILFSATFFSKKIWNVILGLWIVTILVFTQLNTEGRGIINATIRVISSPYNLEFIIGYVLSIFITRKIKIAKPTLVLSICLLFILFLFGVYYHAQLPKFSVNIVFTLFAFFLFYYAISYYNIPIKRTALLMMVGNATYSVYLLHNPLQMIIIRMSPKMDTLFFPIILLVLVVIICSFVGYIYYRIFEVYFLKKARNLFLKM